MRVIRFHWMILIVCILALNTRSSFRHSEVYSMNKLPADQQAAIMSFLAADLFDRGRNICMGLPVS